MTFSIPALAAGVAHLVHLHAQQPSTPRWLRVALSGCGAGLATALHEAGELEGAREALRVTNALLELLTSGTTRSAVSRLHAMLMMVVTSLELDRPKVTSIYAEQVERVLDVESLEVARQVDALMPMAAAGGGTW